MSTVKLYSFMQGCVSIPSKKNFRLSDLLSGSHQLTAGSNFCSEFRLYCKVLYLNNNVEYQTYHFKSRTKNTKKILDV